MALVDLFSGCGGFSLGAHKAGFSVAAAFDIDPILTSSFSYNFPETRLVLSDVGTLTGEEVLSAAGGKVDGIFGGPPCQGFSDIGRRLKDDPRRQLLWHYFRIVNEIRPAFFVMENVVGLVRAGSRELLEGALALVEDSYEILGPVVLDASHFGAATKRKRLFVIGVHKDSGDALTESDLEPFKRPPSTVQAAISDLGEAVYVGDRDGFDTWRIAKVGRPFEYARSLRSGDGLFTGQRPTEHTPDVVRRFKKVQPGKVDTVGRHHRLEWSGQCPTLRAGTGADKGSYQSVRPLHPDEARVITVREAARLQGFPDAHRFHPTVWHSFRMIGNSVSPIIATALFSALRDKLHLDSTLQIAAE
jgi:DNA (cytosine-5)-methyltransferase 1